MYLFSRLGFRVEKIIEICSSQQLNRMLTTVKLTNTLRKRTNKEMKRSYFVTLTSAHSTEIHTSNILPAADKNFILKKTLNPRGMQLTKINFVFFPSITD